MRGRAVGKIFLKVRIGRVRGVYSVAMTGAAQHTQIGEGELHHEEHEGRTITKDTKECGGDRKILPAVERDERCMGRKASEAAMEACAFCGSFVRGTGLRMTNQSNARFFIRRGPGHRTQDDQSCRKILHPPPRLGMTSKKRE